MWNGFEEEIEKASGSLDMTESDLLAKVEEIVEQNNFDKENDSLLIRGCFRNWVAGRRRMQKQKVAPTQASSGSSYIKEGFGMVVSMENIRDNMQSVRDTLKAACDHDLASVYKGGIEIYSRPYGVSITTELENGAYQLTYVANDKEVMRTDYKDGKRPLDEKWFEKMKTKSWEYEQGWVTPIDLLESFQSGDKNEKFCDPLSLVDITRRANFLGQGPNSTEWESWSIQVRDKKNTTTATDFADTVPLFEPLYLTGVWNEERKAFYGTWSTLRSVVLNKDLADDDDKKVAATPSVQEAIEKCLSDNIVSLLSLEEYHNDAQTKPYAERLAITDGMVCNMQPAVNKAGSRTIWISSLDDFDYDLDEYQDTTCWIPENVELDFGVGSHVLVLGRTSQRDITDEDTGETSKAPVTINVSGLLVLEKKGEPTVVSSDDDDGEWW